MANKKNTGVKLKTAKKTLLPHELWTEFEVKGLPVGKQLEIAYTIVEQALQPKHYTLLDALIVLRISRPTFNAWCKKYPIIHEAYEHAKLIITRKRFDDAANREASEKLFKFVPQYCEEYGEYEKWCESVKAAQQQTQPTAINVQMFDYVGNLKENDVKKD